MLRKHTLGFTGVLAAAITVIAAAGCSSTGAGKVVSVGPTFASQSLYATNTTQNGVSIYPAGSATGSGPQYQIGGSNTTLGGPQYVTLDSSDDIFTTNWQAGTSAASIIEFKALATGNVIPFGTQSLAGMHPRGIFDYLATFGTSTTPVDVLVSAVVDSTQPSTFANQLQFFVAGNSTGTGLGAGAYQIVAGPLTGLNVPVGVVADKKGNIYVANSQAGNVEVFSVPTPTTEPSPTATPTASPTPTPTPSGATASPVPSASPTATPINIAPIDTISGALSGIGLPTGIALDGNGNIFVADQASTLCSCPAILRFAAGSNGNVAPTVLKGPAGLLFAPTDVKVDSNGLIYVSDTTKAGASVIYVFAAGASGTTAPTSTLTSPGVATGLGLSP